MIFLREKGPYEKFPIRFQTSCNDQKIWNGLATLTLRVFTIIDLKRGLHLPFPRTTLARLLIMAIIFRTFQAGNRVNNVFHHTMRTTKRILRTDTRSTQTESVLWPNEMPCSYRLGSGWRVRYSEGSGVILATAFHLPEEQYLIALKSFSLPQSLAKKRHAPTLCAWSE